MYPGIVLEFKNDKPFEFFNFWVLIKLHKLINKQKSKLNWKYFLVTFPKTIHELSTNLD